MKGSGIQKYSLLMHINVVDTRGPGTHGPGIFWCNCHLSRRWMGRLVRVWVKAAQTAGQWSRFSGHMLSTLHMLLALFIPPYVVAIQGWEIEQLYGVGHAMQTIAVMIT